MRRDQLWHAIRAACAITQLDDVIVIGSQSILGTYDEDDLPPEATQSLEVDVLARGRTDDETAGFAELLSGIAGELSPFDQTHGFHLDGVDDTTAVLPPGWEERLVKVSNASTRDPLTARQFSGWCLDPHDLGVAKLCAGRTKDLRFVAALIDARFLDPATLRARLESLSGRHEIAAQRAIEWLPGRAERP